MHCVKNVQIYDSAREKTRKTKAALLRGFGIDRITG